MQREVASGFSGIIYNPRRTQAPAVNLGVVPEAGERHFRWIRVSATREKHCTFATLCLPKLSFCRNGALALPRQDCPSVSSFLHLQPSFQFGSSPVDSNFPEARFPCDHAARPISGMYPVRNALCLQGVVFSRVRSTLGRNVGSRTNLGSERCLRHAESAGRGVSARPGDTFRGVSGRGPSR
ncbi:hypothetical protein NPIL_679521 [Nephila pilipes]|uniref:Uncharacterized protein n=1 Tax=Nephila pilipes TaxID=299642 RepID=A0A8X6TSP3_NEPPI|nr:hypothetical protein NPIL_679521 [Nephila pilipes]